MWQGYRRLRTWVTWNYTGLHKATYGYTKAIRFYYANMCLNRLTLVYTGFTSLKVTLGHTRLHNTTQGFVRLHRATQVYIRLLRIIHEANRFTWVYTWLYKATNGGLHRVISSYVHTQVYVYSRVTWGYIG